MKRLGSDLLVAACAVPIFGGMQESIPNNDLERNRMAFLNALQGYEDDRARAGPGDLARPPQVEAGHQHLRPLVVVC